MELILMPHDHDISHGLIRTRQVTSTQVEKLGSYSTHNPSRDFRRHFQAPVGLWVEEEQRMAVSKCIAIAMMKQYLI